MNQGTNQKCSITHCNMREIPLSSHMSAILAWLIPLMSYIAPQFASMCFTGPEINHLENRPGHQYSCSCLCEKEGYKYRCVMH